MTLKFYNQKKLEPDFLIVTLYDDKKRKVVTKSGYFKTAYFSVADGVYNIEIKINNIRCEYITVLYNALSNSFGYFYNLFDNSTKKVLSITDRHYLGLKIERGSLILKNII